MADAARYKVLILEPFPRDACALLEDVADVTQGVADRAYSEDELVALVKDVHGLVITSRDRITRRVIEAAPLLRVITKSGARPVNVDVEAAEGVLSGLGAAFAVPGVGDCNSAKSGAPSR